MLGWVILLLHMALTGYSSVGGWYGLKVHDGFTHMLGVLTEMALGPFPFPCGLKASLHMLSFGGQLDFCIVPCLGLRRTRRKLPVLLKIGLGIGMAPIMP